MVTRCSVKVKITVFVILCWSVGVYYRCRHMHKRVCEKDWGGKMTASLIVCQTFTLVNVGNMLMLWHAHFRNNSSVCVCEFVCCEWYFLHDEIVTQALYSLRHCGLEAGQASEPPLWPLCVFAPAWGHVCIYGLHALQDAIIKRCPMWSGQCRHKHEFFSVSPWHISSVGLTTPSLKPFKPVYSSCCLTLQSLWQPKIRKYETTPETAVMTADE